MTTKERGDPVAQLREHLQRRPDDAGAQLRLGVLLAARGERDGARALLAPLEGGDGPLAAQATAELAALDEEDGRIAAAVARWERLLCDDIDHAQARARLAHLHALTPAPAPTGATATLASPEGVTLLRYELMREIGRGATATVYLARDRALGIELALKVLHPQLASSHRSEACRRFFQEARVAAALRHPGVVAIYDLDEAGRMLVMEHLRGGTIRDRLRALGGAVGRDEARAIARRLLEALAYVHGRGVVHGDITPRNLLLREPGAPVLADFGNARLVEGTGAAEAAGTPFYLAPEMFRGAPSAPRTDLFSVGAIVWELLVGRPMRGHGDLVANRVEAPPLPPGTRSDAGLAALVAALTAGDPDRRPASATDALALV